MYSIKNPKDFIDIFFHDINNTKKMLPYDMISLELVFQWLRAIQEYLTR